MTGQVQIVVAGAGAAGMMAAVTAARQGAKVLLIEPNEKVGRKLYITGKGRCNVTNDCRVDQLLASVPRNGKFLYSAFSRFSPQDTIAFFEKLGVPLKVERGNRVFPQSDRAADVIDALWKELRRCRVELRQDRVTEVAVSGGRVSGVKLEKAGLVNCEAVLLATGGASYPRTGSTGDGYRIAEALGHTITPIRGSLVPLESEDRACSQLQGLSLRNVVLRMKNQRGKTVYHEQGELLFTHFGLSGPLVLSASTYIEDITKHRYICEFDLKPALDEKTLYDRLTRDFAEQGGHSAQGALAKLLPNSMRPVAVEKWGIDPATKAAQITREQKQALVDLCKHWQVPVSALGDKEHAVITAGGVDVREVDPKTMASKLCAGLYFAGEVLDVDARTGGYNLQIAWSTAVAAAKAL